MKALDLFYKICEIPHPSGDTKALRDFIIAFAKEYKCEVKVDNANNIHILKGNPKIAFQAHYDMVLIGDTIEPIIKDNTLFAKDSSLGADNGAAVAVILDLATKCKDFEALITNDEEIGMLGANALELEIKSKIMINLDSENINEICVGCAGGFDADIMLDGFQKKSDKKHIYEIELSGLKGGHSGIDIDKNIPNAIIELLFCLKDIKDDFDILELSGGEKRNSIPSYARAIIATNTELDEKLSYKKLDSKLDSKGNCAYDRAMIDEFLKLHNGVYIVENGSVISSLNFSIIDNNVLKIMIRANRELYLQRHIINLKNLFGKSVSISSLYKPWERKDSAILKTIEKIYEKHNISFKILEIHAGLECGILKEKCKINEIISIGPTIKNPHSKSENMDLTSFEKFQNIVSDLCLK